METDIVHSCPDCDQGIIQIFDFYLYNTYDDDTQDLS